MFAAALPRVEEYAVLLATTAVERGLIGPREAPRLWERHLMNCALLGEVIPRGATVADIGSGAGLPGLVLALTRPDLELSLVEPLLRRSTFLDEAVDGLDLVNVEVVRARAEDLHGTRVFDVVTSRAVAPLPRLLDWSMPLVRAGGVVAAMKGASAADELASAGAALRRQRAGRAEVVRCGDGRIDPPTTVIRVEATRETPLGLPGSQRSRRRGSGGEGGGE